MGDRYVCLPCGKVVSEVKGRRYRAHSRGDGEPCVKSGEAIPDHLDPVSHDADPSVPVEGVDFATCPQCDRKVKLTQLGYFQPHDTTLRGGGRCPVSGVRAKHARRMEDRLLPGDEPASPHPEVRDSAVAPEVVVAESKAPHEINLARDPMTESAAPAASSASTTSSSPESGSTSPESPEQLPPAPATSSDVPEEPADAEPPVLHLAPLLDDVILQPFSHISQPFPVPVRIRMKDAMSEEGKELAARLRETFYAYTNRNAGDNRSAQTTLGPSEIGSPCDRQLAMKLLGIRPVNPQEGWAPFVGTAVHAELARMFEWANGAGSGRYLVELPVQIGSELVPYGTLDLYDGVLYVVGDHKLMGRYSLDKLIQNGPSETYRVQLQTYGLGAEQAGLKVKKVALIAWPRQESSLDKLYVHVEPYDRKVALDAIARVERIAADIARTGPQGVSPMEIAQTFPAGDDCKWCPFHLKADKEMKRGCPGK